MINNMQQSPPSLESLHLAPLVSTMTKLALIVQHHGKDMDEMRADIKAAKTSSRFMEMAIAFSVVVGMFALIAVNKTLRRRLKRLETDQNLDRMPNT